MRRILIAVLLVSVWFLPSDSQAQQKKKKGANAPRAMTLNAGGRVAAVEVLLNTVLVAELIEKGDLTAVKEAMEKSLAEGSQSFEADIARLITDGVVSRDEGMIHADSPTNLIWRLHNDTQPVSKAAPAKDEHDGATFTNIMLDVLPEPSRAMPLGAR